MNLYAKRTISVSKIMRNFVFKMMNFAAADGKDETGAVIHSTNGRFIFNLGAHLLHHHPPPKVIRLVKGWSMGLFYYKINIFQ